MTQSVSKLRTNADILYVHLSSARVQEIDRGARLLYSEEGQRIRLIFQDLFQNDMDFKIKMLRLTDQAFNFFQRNLHSALTIALQASRYGNQPNYAIVASNPPVNAEMIKSYLTEAVCHQFPPPYILH
jgi:hypothetical protein